jgi:glycosyltransferase involved in cell wall biosynthesis
MPPTPAPAQAPLIPAPSLEPPAPAPQPGIAVFGALASPYGLGEACRRAVAALRGAGIPVSTHISEPAKGDLRIPFPPDDPDAPAYDTAVFHFNPGEWLRRLTASRREPRKIGVWHWELPVFPPRWVPDALAVNEVWVPSRFVADLVRAGTGLPVRIVPHPAIIVPVDRTLARASFGFPESRRIILTAFDFLSYSTRKNPDGLLRAFADAFPKGIDAPLLVVKYHHDDPVADQAQVERIRAMHNVHVIDRSLTQEEMRELYAAADAFVSLHRSEGFGLNLLDMMALGRACIATGFSGNVDFMSAENSILIPWTMRAVGPGEYPFGDGQWWAEPDHDAAVEAIRWVGTAADSALDALGARAAADINRDYSLARVGAIARAAWEGGTSPSGAVS